jgi:hypothetical protein
MRRQILLVLLLALTALVPGASAQISGPSPALGPKFLAAGTISGTGATAAFAPPSLPGEFNVVFGGASGPNGAFTATIRLERSFDGGTTWYVAGAGGTGAQALYSTPNSDVSLVVAEPEAGVLYRLNCTAYTSGTINWRVSGNTQQG